MGRKAKERARTRTWLTFLTWARWLKASRETGRMRKGCRSRASKDFTAGAALWSFPHHTLLQPHLGGREGARAGLPRAQVHGQLFLVKPDPANYISQAPFPTGFCQGEALREPWEEEGSKSQMIPLPFPAPAPTPSLTCASGPHQVPSSWDPGAFPFHPLQFGCVGRSSLLLLLMSMLTH